MADDLVKPAQERQAAARLHGEWFSPSEGLLADVAQAAAGPQPLPPGKAEAVSYKDHDADAALDALIRETFAAVLEALLDRMPTREVATLFGSCPASIKNWREGKRVPNTALIMTGARRNGLVKVWFFGVIQALQRAQDRHADLKTAFIDVMDEVAERVRASQRTPLFPLTCAAALGMDRSRD